MRCPTGIGVCGTAAVAGDAGSTGKADAGTPGRRRLVGFECRADRGFAVSLVAFAGFEYAKGYLEKTVVESEEELVFGDTVEWKQL